MGSCLSTSAANNDVEVLTKRNNDLEAEMAKLRAEMSTMKKQVDDMKKQAAQDDVLSKPTVVTAPTQAAKPVADAKPVESAPAVAPPKTPTPEPAKTEENPALSGNQVAADDFKDHAIYKKWESMEEPKIEVTKKTWEQLEGPKLEPLLDDLDLVDLAFIVECVEAGLPLPRQQEVPKGAKINRSNLDRIKMPLNSYALSVMVLSYPWLDPDHPDKNLAVCKKLMKCFKAFLQGAKTNGPNCTVGLMMDYPCLPQKRRDHVDDRTPEQKQRFKRALGSINEWYMHPYTSVIVFDVDLPGADSGHLNLRPYVQRGWCTFEYRASCLVKGMFCLWSLAGYEKAGAAGSWAAGVQGGKSAILRAAPMTPPKFDKMLREGVKKGEIAFTAKADLDLVINQYDAAFNKAFGETRELMYQALKWPDEQICEMASALAYAKENGLLKKTETLRIWGNAWTDVGNKAVREAIDGLKITLFDT